MKLSILLTIISCPAGHMQWAASLCEIKIAHGCDDDLQFDLDCNLSFRKNNQTKSFQHVNLKNFKSFPLNYSSTSGLIVTALIATANTNRVS